MAASLLVSVPPEQMHRAPSILKQIECCALMAPKSGRSRRSKYNEANRPDRQPLPEPGCCTVCANGDGARGLARNIWMKQRTPTVGYQHDDLLNCMQVLADHRPWLVLGPHKHSHGHWRQ